MDVVVLPVHDVNPVRRTPWFTYALVAANIIVFLLTPAAMGNAIGESPAAVLCEQVAFYDRYAAIPRELVDNEQLPEAATGEVAGTDGDLVSCVTEAPSYEKNPVLSALYSMFFHGGWLHLLGNMLFLWIFGNNIEDRMGRLRFLIFYLLAGFVATYGFAFANPELTIPTIGASGAVAGVLGAYLVLFPRTPVWSVVPVLFFLPLRLPAWFVLGTWFALQGIYSAGFALSGAGEVAYLAHVLGFLFGAIVAIPFRMTSGRKRPPPESTGGAYIYRKEWR